MARFFYQSCRAGDEDILDFCLSRYADMDYLMELDYETGIRVIQKGVEKFNEQRLHEEYVVLIPQMVQTGTYVSFKEFLNKSKSEPVKSSSTEDIMAKVKHIANATFLKLRKEE